jgi:tripartite-type tricarboxylate transporter receptor subunit TctC
MTLGRRPLLLGAAALPLARPARAQAFPTRPVRMVIPFPPGGVVDTVARMMNNALTEALGQPIVIETRPGAGATIGAAAVASAPADGYTILFTSAALASAPATIPNLPYDALRDFAPLSLLGDVPLVLTAAPQLGVSDMAGLLAAARARPGAIGFATPGNGTPIHLAMELLQREAGITLLHVPYRASPITDVIAGRVGLHMDSGPGAIQRGRQGQVKLLGVANPQRLPSQPDLPAIAETVPGYAATTWFAFFAPVRVPQAAQAALTNALVAASTRPVVRAALAELGMEVQATGPEPLAQLLRADTERFGAIARAVGARLD